MNAYATCSGPRQSGAFDDPTYYCPDGRPMPEPEDADDDVCEACQRERDLATDLAVDRAGEGI